MILSIEFQVINISELQKEIETNSKLTKVEFIAVQFGGESDILTAWNLISSKKNITSISWRSMDIPNSLCERLFIDLQQCSHIKSIDLAYCRFFNEAIISFLPTQTNISLSFFDVTGISMINTEGLGQLLNALSVFHGLKTLIISDCPLILASSELITIISHCDKLRNLNLSSTTLHSHSFSELLTAFESHQFIMNVNYEAVCDEKYNALPKKFIDKLNKILLHNAKNKYLDKKNHVVNKYIEIAMLSTIYFQKMNQLPIELLRFMLSYLWENKGDFSAEQVVVSLYYLEKKCNQNSRAHRHTLDWDSIKCHQLDSLFAEEIEKYDLRKSNHCFFSTCQLNTKIHEIDQKEILKVDKDQLTI